MEQVVDSLRRIIGKWTKPSVPLIANANIGDEVLQVKATNRFKVNDEIVLVDSLRTYEKPSQFRVTEVIDKNHIRVSSPISLKVWRVSDTAVVQKLIDGSRIEGIYVGDPENIPKLPAITINPISEEVPEWMTMDSVKTVYNIEVGIFVEDSTQEEGSRLLWRLTKLVKFALMNNIFPLVNDYQTTALTQNASVGDGTIAVADSSLFTCGNVILLDNNYISREIRVESIVDDTHITVTPLLANNWLVADDTQVILVNRFIMNSFPRNIQFGKIHKGTLMKAAVIDWFGWEEVIPPRGGDGWGDPQIH